MQWSKKSLLLCCVFVGHEVVSGDYDKLSVFVHFILWIGMN